MPIKVKCGNADCGKTLQVKDELAGKTVRCPGCQQPLKVPAANAAAATVKPSKPAAAAAPAKSTAAPAKTSPVKSAAPPPVPKASAKVAAGPVAKKGGKAPPPDDEEDEAPVSKKKGKASAKDADELDPELEKLWETSPMLNEHERLQVKKKFAFMGAKYHINDPDTEEQVGIAREQISIFTAILRSFSFIRPWMGTNIQVREEEKGPILFTVRKPVQWFSLTTKIDIYDQFATKIGYFQTKLFSLTGGFWVYDAEGNQIAEVKNPLLKPHLTFNSPEGDELARIANELWEAKKFKITFGAPGTNITMSEEVRQHNNLKVLLIATVIAMEFTGVGGMKRPGGLK